MFARTRRGTIRHLGVASTFISLTAWGSPTWAQSASGAASSSPENPSGSSPTSDPGATLDPAPTLEQARAAFLQGRALMDQEKWQEAAAEFEYAARAKNTPGLRYYVGYCLEQAGELVRALREYDAARQLLETQPAQDVEKLIPEAVERVQGALGTLNFPDLPEGAVVRLDGHVIVPADPVLVVPGPHEISVTHPDYEPFATNVDVAVREVLAVDVSLQEIARQEEPPSTNDSPRAAPTDSSPRPHAQRAVFWSSVGVGAVGLGTGVVGSILFASASKSAKNLGEDVDDASNGGASVCSDPTSAVASSCTDLEKAGRRRDVAGNLMVGGFAAAGVGALGALLSHFLWPEASERFRVEADATFDGSYFSLQGKF